MLTFVPLAVEGISGVRQVTVQPDLLDFATADGSARIRLLEIAHFPRPRILWRIAFALGLRPRSLPVGERDWCQPAGKQFFRFYCQPPVVVYVPGTGTEDYGDSLFRRIQDVLAAGGFDTIDLA